MLKTFLRARAIQADHRGFPVSAVECFRRHLEKHPDDAVAQFRLAENLRAIGKLTAAKAALEGLKNVPPNKLWFVNLCWGELHMDNGNFQTAEQFFRKATELNGRSTIPWIYLGGCLAKQEEFIEACAVLEKGLLAEGDLDEVYLNLGYQKRALGEYNAARECFIKACALDPNYDAAKLALKDLAFLRQSVDRKAHSDTSRPKKKRRRGVK